ncbi:MAG: toxin-antitoxin system YwqK family antitoxin [Bacteroidales bacterium]
MNKCFLLFLFVSFSVFSSAQNDIDPNGYNVFYHPNGVKSSEGKMRDGKPDGFWKTYNDKGVLISEGNRKNFLLDSLWRFYNNDGRINMEVNYTNGKKDGIRTLYLPYEIRKENFVNGRRHGMTNIYYPEGSIWRQIPFQKGLENGFAYIFNKEGRIVEVQTYDRGYVVSRERINRFDSQQKKHGRWKWFYSDMQVRKMGTYFHGKEDGIFVEFDTDGSAINSKRYKDGNPIDETESYEHIVIKKDYYSNGQVKNEVSYSGDQRHGLSKEYDKNGHITGGAVYYKGRLTGKGLITDNGLKQGKWFELYADSTIRAEGQFIDDKRYGQWLFYYPNAKLEQRGLYDINGNPDGKWMWYYSNGNIWRTEYFKNGMHDGSSIEYNPKGEIISKGNYFQGKRIGKWIVSYGDHREVGEYANGRKTGLWKYFHDNGKQSFNGKFVEGQPHGVHSYYYENGKMREQGKYQMGRKHGTWREYATDGTLLVWITYKNGKEEKIDGVFVSND